MPTLRGVTRRSLRSPGPSWLWTALAPVVGRAARGRWPAVPGRVVLVPPAGAGSLGDDALLTVLTRELGRDTDLRVVDVSRSGPAGGIGAALHAAPPRGWLALLRARPEVVVVVGADVMNGYYSDWSSARRWDLLACAGAAGIDAVAAGFSWPEPGGCGRQSVRAARRAATVRSSCREPISAERFAVATGRPALSGADAGFLLDPDPDGRGVRQVHDWADERRRAGEHPIGLNLNGLTVGLPDEHPARVAAVADGVAALADDGIAVVLVPHDSRPAAGDEAWAAAVQQALDGRAPATTVAVPRRSAEAKAMVSALDAVVTGRLHLAIACLGSGVPVALLDYQGKGAGLDVLFPGAEVCTTMTADDWCDQLGVTAGRLVVAAPTRAAAIARARDDVVAAAQRLVDDARPGVSA